MMTVRTTSARMRRTSQLVRILVSSVTAISGTSAHAVAWQVTLCDLASSVRAV
jgi:hypothetical protein